MRIWAGDEIVVEDDDVGVGGADHQLELLELAFAEIGRLIGRGRVWVRRPTTSAPAVSTRPGQLVQVVAGGVVIGQLNADQNGRLALYALITVDFFH